MAATGADDDDEVTASVAGDHAADTTTPALFGAGVVASTSAVAADGAASVW